MFIYSEKGVKVKTGVIPWVDCHVMPQTNAWNEHQLWAMTGCVALIMSAANYHWSPYRPVRANDVFWLWDLALKWREHIAKAHPYKVFVSISMREFSTHEQGAEEIILSKMPRYLGLPEVVAVGELGIEVTHYTTPEMGKSVVPSIEHQKTLLTEQLKLAKQFSLPVIIHTPMKKTYEQGWDEHLTQPTFPWPDAKRKAAEISIDLVKDLGLDPNSVLIDHADASIVDLVLKETQYFLGFSVGSPWRFIEYGNQLSIKVIVDTIKKYGPDRIIIDSGMAGNQYQDYIAIPRLIFSLRRHGISEENIVKVVFENSNRMFRLELMET